MDINTTPTRQELASLKAAGFRKEFEDALSIVARIQTMMERLPFEIIPKCEIVTLRLIIYHCDREEALSAMTALRAGRWAKKLNSIDTTKIDYVATVDGVPVEVWGAAPPISCRIVETEVEVPAHTEIQRSIVCHE